LAKYKKSLGLKDVDMQNTRLVEISVGIFVAAGIAAFFMLGLKVSNFNAF